MRDDDEQPVSLQWLYCEAEARERAQRENDWNRETIFVAAGLSVIPRSPSVYVLMSHDETLVKIGKATNPRDRIRDIRHMNPHPLRVFVVVPGYTRLEGWFHATFNRLRMHGEW